ncbi:esterase/lipase family protein [Microseira wollei]|uniref:GPI inositol-deacylase PGAP1-like alpha/beta domain-containing protein n=1 Tax=Microseira wollei NIES-4236 TaxID=2530354 RepID=A0AAV3X906_9CYAN|nr:hypothetical protein [Microseira wollei]GET37821.1 hypothetical protein MiSe_25750 [Microseira wollei NIES-4236]
MKDSNGLLKISGCENPERSGDVVFVHGLGGNPRDTWHYKKGKSDDFFWPAKLGEDLPEFDIWSLGYAVEPSAWKGNTLPLADRATNTLKTLGIYGIGKRPVIFITHSMGGLLVKQMLRHAQDYGNPKWKAIVDQTKGIVFLSTPHSGADLANWVNYIGGILRTTVSVRELEANHSRLRELNNLYRNHELLCKIPMEVYFETEKTNGVLVVDETSADPGIKGVIPVGIDYANHISICKPESKESLVYLGVKQFIEEDCLKVLKQPIQLEDKDKLHETITTDNRRIGNYLESGARIHGPVAGRDQTNNYK